MNKATFKLKNAFAKKYISIDLLLMIFSLIIPTVIVVSLYLHYGSNVPFWDEWDYLTDYQKLQEDGCSFQFLWTLFRSQHVDHRTFVTQLVRIFAWKISHCNNLLNALLLYINLIAAIMIVFLYCRNKKCPLMYLIPIPTIAFSLRQGLMLFWPAYLEMPTLIICATAAFYFFYIYTVNAKKIYFFLSITFAFMASFCRAEGLLTWLAFVAFFIAQKLFENKKILRKDSICFVFAGIATYAIYFYNWKWVNKKFASANIWNILKTFVTLIGSPFVNNNSEATTMWSAYVIGTLILAIFALFLYSMCKEKYITEMAFPFLMIAFFLGAVLMTAFGRSELPILTSQYVPMSIWFIIGLYFGIVEMLCKKEKTILSLKGFSLFTFFVSFILSIGFYSSEAKPVLDNLQACAYCVQNYDEITEGMKKTYIYPIPEKIENRLKWLKDNHYFLFNESRKYTYPFEDCFIAEKMENFVLPPIKEETVGRFNVDLINGEPANLSSAITASADGGVYFDIWALDDAHNSLAVTAIMEIEGKYYELKRYSREDVAAAFSNNDYLNSGFRGFISTRSLEKGTHSVDLIVICDDGNSYYSTTLGTISV